MILTGCTQNKWFEPFFITDVLEAIFVRLFMFMGKPFSILAGFIKINPQKNKILFKIIAGMSISFPLVLIILVLLSSADGVFKYYLDNIPNLFNYMKIDELFWQTLFITVVFLASFSYLSSLMQNKSISSKPGYYLHKFLDPTIVSTVLVSVNIIYVFFVTIQFTYLLGGIKPQNLSFSEYARKGFFELVLVSIINLSILLFNINFTSNSGKISTIFNKISNSLLILCTLVMLYSAHYRMWLYEETYGYTYLRVFTHSFMIFIFITLIVTAIKVWNTELPLLKYYIIISIISYMAINFVNVDSIIAQKNIQRYQRGKDLDLSYFYVLSYDSVPYLESIINDENYSDRIKVFFKSKLMNLNERNDWQSFNLSAYVAKKIIEKY